MLTFNKQTISSKPTTISEDFLCNNHNATGMQLIPLEVVQFNRDSVGKARKAYLIGKGQTLEPHGLNKKGGIYRYKFYVVRLTIVGKNNGLKLHTFIL